MSVMWCQKCGDVLIDTDFDVESWVRLKNKKDEACWCLGCQELYADEILEEE